uniref:hypothetical protein n=1 Tax=Paractinoplanes polyasparticus TaxID=2856853 RepID=UPI001C85573A|nr:hypothetical protein [Actinoplanes polyasparticus]
MARATPLGGSACLNSSDGDVISARRTHALVGGLSVDVLVGHLTPAEMTTHLDELTV